MPAVRSGYNKEKKTQEKYNEAETRALIANLIRDNLYENLPEAYTYEQCDACRSRVYEYVYTRYGHTA